MDKNLTLEKYLYQHLAGQTAKNYLYTINNFLKLHPKARRYKYQDLVNYMAGVREQYANAQTCNRVLAAIKRYYDYLVYTGQREENPCQTLTLKKSINQNIQLQDLFTSKELEALMHRENRYRHLDLRNKVIISLLIYQGLTSDELIRLEVGSVDLDSGTVYIKGSSKLNRRTLDLKANQIQLFYNYINEVRPEMLWMKNKTEKLLLNKLSNPISVDGINAMIEPLTVLYPDRPLNPRSIRMSVVSNWLNEKKLPLEDVQELAGHKWPSTTEKYFRVDSLEQRELINKFFPL
ncbi:tyrosine-type recombinase/integrase [Flavobacterium sp.]|uniref:tyrosine-type recombinase/integrase n=1 Tax=Flavobacterium sp. TaxID=239 RepID=UPI004034C61C